MTTSVELGPLAVASRAAQHLRTIRLAELDLAAAWMPPRSRLLGIGAGAGWQAAELASRGFDVEAVDVEGSDYAADRVCPVRHYDGSTLPYADGEFDVVWSSNVLEHVAHLDRMGEEIHRVLRPGGLVVHALPTASWRLWTSLALAAKLPALWWELLRERRARGRSWRATSVRALRLLWPRSHGERGNAGTELYYFSRFFWRSSFRRTGWRVADYRPCRLFYTGYDVLGGRLSLSSRRFLSSLLGSACALYLLRPR